MIEISAVLFKSFITKLLISAVTGGICAGCILFGPKTQSPTKIQWLIFWVTWSTMLLWIWEIVKIV